MVMLCNRNCGIINKYTKKVHLKDFFFYERLIPTFPTSKIISLYEEIKKANNYFVILIKETILYSSKSLAIAIK